jgi:hypothetical protein
MIFALKGIGYVGVISTATDLVQASAASYNSGSPGPLVESVGRNAAVMGGGWAAFQTGKVAVDAMLPNRPAGIIKIGVPGALSFGAGWLIGNAVDETIGLIKAQSEIRQANEEAKQLDLDIRLRMLMIR